MNGSSTTPRRPWSTVLRQLVRRGEETGQAALVLVMSMILIISVGTTMLVQSTLVQQSVVTVSVLDHAAYRAVQAAVSDYLYTLNSNFEYPLCNSANTPGSDTMTAHGWTSPILPTPSFCNTAPPFRTWIKVSNTIPTYGVPEWYAIGNPNFSQASGNVEKVQFVGAAGYPGNFRYETETVNFQTSNDFLLNLFWDNLQEINPIQGNTTGCNFLDWNNNITEANISGGTYQGKAGTSDEYWNSGNQGCPVYFKGGETINGPVYSNDSIFVANGQFPAFEGPVRTADPFCQFVDTGSASGLHSSPTCGSILTALKAHNYGAINTAVQAALSASTTTPSNGVGSPPTYQIEPIPSSNTNKQISNVAKTGGCYYQGPTYITFNAPSATYPNGSMNVTTGSGSSCAGHSSTGTNVLLPNNGVIYVDDTTKGTCVDTSPVLSETEVPDTSYPNGTPFSCRGDAFVNGDIYGALTVDAANNVVVTGNLFYCSDPTAGSLPSCSLTDYNDAEGNTNPANNGGVPLTPTYYPPGGPPAGSFNTSSVLGLIANEFVEVNNPVNNSGTDPQTCTTQTQGYVAGSTFNNPTDLRYCAMYSIGIDAAILALNQSFLVNAHDQQIGNGQTNNLYINGAIAQDYRGSVGTFSGSTLTGGYNKQYTWDWRLAFLGPPSYLKTGVNGNTPYWNLISSNATVGVLCQTLTLATPLTTTGEALACSHP
jgi:hypothetical protein